MTLELLVGVWGPVDGGREERGGEGNEEQGKAPCPLQ